MKKRLWLFICGVALLNGCGTKNVIVDNNVRDESNKITESLTVEKNYNLVEETIISTSNSITPGQKEKDINLEYVEEVREKYNKILSEKEYLFNVSDKAYKDNNHYEIPIYVNKQKTSSNNWAYENIDENIEIWFYTNSDGLVNKSFHTVFTKRTDNNLIKEYIKVSLLALDSSIDDKMAEEYVRKMVESTGSSNRSDIIDAGEYHIFFEKNKRGSLSSNGDMTVYAYHNSEINKEVNKEEYKKYSVEEMKASLNWGEKAYITVTPYTNGAPIGEVMEFKATSDEGDEYIIYYDFNTCLIDFEQDKRYTLYGVILKPDRNTLRFRADYYEE